MAAISQHIQAMRSGTDGQKQKAAFALGWLAHNAENQMAIAAAGGVPPLVSLVGGGTDGQKQQAAAALANLA